MLKAGLTLLPQEKEGKVRKQSKQSSKNWNKGIFDSPSSSPRSYNFGRCGVIPLISLHFYWRVSCECAKSSFTYHPYTAKHLFIFHYVGKSIAWLPSSLQFRLKPLPKWKISVIASPAPIIVKWHHRRLKVLLLQLLRWNLCQTVWAPDEQQSGQNLVLQM